MPALALDMLRLLAAQLDALDVKLKLIETRLMASHRENPLSQCLASQPGIGPIGAVSFALRVTDPKSFRSGRHFAAWLGLTPKDNSSGGRHRQGRISRQGNEALRKLVVLGATAVIRFARPGHASPWLLTKSASAQAEEACGNRAGQQDGSDTLGHDGERRGLSAAASGLRPAHLVLTWRLQGQQ